MRHRKRVFKIGRRAEHVRALLANQVCSLVVEGRIKTTVVKAKETRRLAERMITLAKGGTLHHRRRAIAKLHNLEAVRHLFSEIGPRFTNRPGGYTRIVRLGTRRGDGADVCFLELVEADGAGGYTAQVETAEAAETEASAAAAVAPETAAAAPDTAVAAAAAAEATDAEAGAADAEGVAADEVVAEAEAAEDAEAAGDEKQDA